MRQKLPIFPTVPSSHLTNANVGVRVGLFTPGKAFEVVVKQRIAQLKTPCVKLIELVVEEINHVATTGLAKVICRPKMQPDLLFQFSPHLLLADEPLSTASRGVGANHHNLYP